MVAGLLSDFLTDNHRIEKNLPLTVHATNLYNTGNTADLYVK